VITDTGIASRLNDLAKREGVIFPVHVEVDTGMGRTGVAWSQAISFIRGVTAFTNLRIEGIYSHFSSADESDITFTHSQLERFKSVLTAVNEEIVPPPITHVSNSAASLRIPEAGLKMIRPGLYVYGISPLGRSSGSVDTSPRPAMSFRSRVVYVKDIEKGSPIGYNRTFVSNEKMKVATVAVGYRDGLDYRLSNRGAVLIDGRKCPIVGTICMDMLMVDITHMRNVTRGDCVTILGEDHGSRISAEDIAEITGTISYDVITKLGNKVPRIYYKGAKPVKITSYLGTWESDRKELNQGG
jgi:alanine racemase